MPCATLPGVRTLTVLPAPPAAQGGAADRCAIGLLLGLRAHDVDARAIAPTIDGTWPADAADLGVVRVPVVPRTGPAARLAHLRRPLGDLSRTALHSAVRDAARTTDLIHLDRSIACWLDAGASKPCVMSLHHRARLDRDPAALWRDDGRELALFRMLERRAIHRYRWIVASSDVVARSIREDRPRADVTVVSLSLDPSAYPPAGLDGPPTAGIVGLATWPPTLDALARLSARVWPLVRAAVPTASLLVAGRGTSAVVASDPGQGIDVIGEIASTQAFLSRLSVLVYPVSRGSGMKVKVLEAMASGVPVVTTSAGSEGLVPCDGVVVHEDDEALARAAAGLLADPVERRERGLAARASFLAHHAPLPATEPLLDLYRRVG